MPAIHKRSQGRLRPFLSLKRQRQHGWSSQASTRAMCLRKHRLRQRQHTCHRRSRRRCQSSRATLGQRCHRRCLRRQAPLRSWHARICWTTGCATLPSGFSRLDIRDDFRLDRPTSRDGRPMNHAVHGDDYDSLDRPLWCVASAAQRPLLTPIQVINTLPDSRPQHAFWIAPHESGSCATTTQTTCLLT